MSEPIHPLPSALTAPAESSCKLCGKPIKPRDRIGRVGYDAAGKPIWMHCVGCALKYPRRP